MTRQKRASFEIVLHLLLDAGTQESRYGPCSHSYSRFLQHNLPSLLSPCGRPPPNQPWQHKWESFSYYKIIAGNCDVDAQGNDEASLIRSLAPENLSCPDLSVTLRVFRMKVFFVRERRDKLIFEHFQTPLSPLRWLHCSGRRRRLRRHKMGLTDSSRRSFNADLKTMREGEEGQDVERNTDGRHFRGGGILIASDSPLCLASVLTSSASFGAIIIVV